MSAPSAPKNIAVIGLGGISQSVHLPLLQRNSDRFNITALVDLSAQRGAQMAQRFGGALSFTSVQELIDAIAGGLPIDGAIIATTGSHAPDTERLIRTGVKVLSEKPLAFSRAEHDQLAALEGELGIDLGAWLRVGYMKEHDPAVQQATQLLDGKKIRAVRVEILHPADGAQLEFANLLAAPTDVAADAIKPLIQATTDTVNGAIGTADETLHKLYTNVVLGSVIHDISVLRKLVGGIGSVTLAQHWGERFPGSLHLGGQLRNHNAPWTLDWHFIDDYPEYQEIVTVHHEEGTVEFIFSVPYLLNAPTRLEITTRTAPLGVSRTTQTWPQEEAFERELRSFHDLLNGDPQAPGATLADSSDDVNVGQLMIALLARSKGVTPAQKSEISQL